MHMHESNHRLKSLPFCLTFNLVCSFFLILLNKWLYTNIGFPNLALTLLHFISTFVGLIICERFDVILVKSIPLNEIFFMSALFCSFVICTNLSLEFNSLGAYELAKLTITAVAGLIEIFHYKKKFDLKIKCTLISVIIGTILYFYCDKKFSILGSCYALIGVVLTSVHQISFKSKQYELQMNSIQLLYYEAPLSCGLLAPVLLLYEIQYNTFPKSLTIIQSGLVIVSCIIAFFVNLSVYWIVRNIDPLTYNAFRLVKFFAILLGSLIAFSDTVSIMQLTGAIMTLLGLTLHGYFKNVSADKYEIDF